MVSVLLSDAHYCGLSLPLPLPGISSPPLSQNFLVSIFESQFGRMMTLGNGSTTRLGEMTDELNLGFTIVFIVELLINLLGYWPQAFIRNAWVSLALSSSAPPPPSQDGQTSLVRRADLLQRACTKRTRN